MSGPASPDAMRASRIAWQNRGSDTAAKTIIGITASFTAAPLEPFLWWHIKERGLPEVELLQADFNQVRQCLLDPDAGFGSAVDAVLVLWRIEDLFPELVSGLCLQQAEAEQRLVEECRLLAADAVALQERTGKLVLFGSPPPILRADTDPGSLLPGRSLMAAHRTIANAVERGLAGSRVHSFDVSTSMSLFGIEAALDWRKWFLYRQPYTEAFWWRLADDIARGFRALSVPRKKCLIVDCDNTLWGGVIGEDGIGGIALGEDFPGSAFVAFQRHIKQLVASGVFLAIASKNEPADVWQVFDEHDAMALRRSDVSVAEIGWGGKAEAVERIAAQLNIGLDAMVFVDDSAIEIAAVRERLPDVTCLQVPEEELADLPFLLNADCHFDMVSLTAEDRERTAMFRSESQREELRRSSSPDGFLRSLQLEVTIGEAKPRQIARVAQLINKTNQFNLTTRRRTETDVAALLDDPHTLVYALDLTDRFGSYGLVGVAIVSLEESSADIDTFLVSCRALGRGVERAFLATIARDVQQREKATLRACYLFSGRNAMCAEFLPAVGFVSSGEREGGFTASPSALIAIDPWIVVRKT